ncbi:MAG: aerobic carbon-monoxide dehydrogenase large subunit [Solirubrobacteraceae bacterium]|nr:aerobic carbon-monoxide dehydrogenase large subunit [Solirubrobacteraceae bacterium]
MSPSETTPTDTNGTDATNGQSAYVGRRMRRKEDPPLLTGKGRYTDDMVVPGMLYAAIVRSTEAHARIASIDTSRAAEAPGIHGVFTAEDLDLAAGMPMAWVPPGVEVKTPEHWPLARGEVKHVGQGVAVVFGEDKYATVDAAGLVEVAYETLPVVVDPEAALTDGSPLVHEEFGTNKTHEWGLGSEDMDVAWEEADVVLERRIVNHRTAGAPIEPRACIADYRAGYLTLWTTTQIPHLTRSFLAGSMQMSEDHIRVVAPDVGGAFGVKLNHYPEEAIACAASRKLGRPIKWTETRSEHMATTIHGRDQIDYVKMGVKRDGTITGIHINVIADLGAYYLLLTPFIPCFTAFVAGGCYKIPRVRTDITGVFTNKFPTDATRGAGRPEATHLLEVMVDQAAAELGISPIEIRRRNFIPKEDFPATVAVGIVYDSGDYHGSLDKLLSKIDLDAFERERAELQKQGIYRGIGFSTYMEICGLAPSRIVGPGGVGIQAGFWESALVRVHPSGSVTVYTGTSPHGQGLDTSLAQIVADRLGTSPEVVEVMHGDTNTGPYGMGTYGSRSLSVGGEAVARAAQKVQDKAKAIVAHVLEAAPEDIEVTGDRFSVRGSPGKGMALSEISGAAYIPENLPDGMEPGLEETTFYDPTNFVYPFGAHACVVDVDAETGRIDVSRYVAVDDCGPAINPLLIEGQVHGGIVHALGQALYERIHYDENGQLVTSTFLEYCIPSAADVPSFETDRTETKSPSNSLGVKGIGEAGTIAASGAVVNAVVDALRPLGVTFINMPLNSMHVWETIQEARS